MEKSMRWILCHLMPFHSVEKTPEKKSYEIYSSITDIFAEKTAEMIEGRPFADDNEKMADFRSLTKETLLQSYLTEEYYDATKAFVDAETIRLARTATGSA